MLTHTELDLLTFGLLDFMVYFWRSLPLKALVLKKNGIDVNRKFVIIHRLADFTVHCPFQTTDEDAG